MSTLNINAKLAAKGYDVVAYFDGEATPGDPALMSEYQGAVYYFKNEANKQRFEQSPASYLPAYGGWCAYAMSEGKQFDVDPRQFKIVNNRLLLFYDGMGGDTKAIWEHGEISEAERLQKADANWAAS